VGLSEEELPDGRVSAGVVPENARGRGEITVCSLALQKGMVSLRYEQDPTIASKDWNLTSTSTFSCRRPRATPTSWLRTTGRGRRRDANSEARVVKNHKAVARRAKRGRTGGSFQEMRSGSAGGKYFQLLQPAEIFARLRKSLRAAATADYYGIYYEKIRAPETGVMWRARRGNTGRRGAFFFFRMTGNFIIPRQRENLSDRNSSPRMKFGLLPLI
jgi:hypothetical protein